ncbi:hypothetical protein FE782_06190 [Paenibacillus antri]|uniref:DUF1269 domain-containing protein n=1 Tax=Paenibacillus antri TaxID=2582848 RepID=A0A5R9GHV7_9BACL|nr:hypothetical protein [Paenibacillus antri]TLS52958.1 hypothetical protein FE782_06190 [Paenibacillus antri]
MHVIASFHYSTYIEIALAELEQQGIERKRLIAVPLETRPSGRSMIDTMHRSDGESLIDAGMALGAASSVVTASLGMTLAWGPVYWGLIGAAGGFTVGFLIDWSLTRRRRRRSARKKGGDVVLVVDCEPHQADRVADTLWRHQALGVAVVT